MPTVDPAVAAYLAALPEERRVALTRLFALIRHERPDLRETLQGNMPTYQDDQGPLLAVASQKNAMCLYLDPALLDSYRHELEHLHRGHNCIRFRSLDELPKPVLRAMLAEAGRVVD